MNLQRVLESAGSHTLEGEHTLQPPVDFVNSESLPQPDERLGTTPLNHLTNDLSRDETPSRSR
jgi:hypothetical protein